MQEKTMKTLAKRESQVGLFCLFVFYQQCLIRLQLFALMTGQQAGQVQISGDATVLKRLLAYASKFEKTFNVIEP